MHLSIILCSFKSNKLKHGPHRIPIVSIGIVTAATHCERVSIPSVKLVAGAQRCEK